MAPVLVLRAARLVPDEVWAEMGAAADLADGLLAAGRRPARALQDGAMAPPPHLFAPAVDACPSSAGASGYRGRSGGRR